jgi:hypothetical protein
MGGEDFCRRAEVPRYPTMPAAAATVTATDSTTARGLISEKFSL